MKRGPDDPTCWCDDCAEFQYHRSQGRLPRLTLTEELHNLHMAMTAFGHEFIRAYRIDRFIEWLNARLTSRAKP